MTDVNVNTQVTIGSGGSGGEGGAIVLVIILWAIWMVFYPSYYITTHLYSNLRLAGMHPLFAGILAGLPSLFIFVGLWLFKEFRFLYFGMDTILATSWVITYVQAQSDSVWAGFFGLITFIACSAATYFISTHEDLPDATRGKYASDIIW